MIKTIINTIIIVFALTTQTHGNTLAKSGILDLRQNNFTTHPVVSTTGEWNFYWQKFIKPNSTAKPDCYIKVPGVWKNLKINNKTISSSGYCTYRLNIILPKTTDEFAIQISTLGGAAKIIINGQVKLEIGKIGKTKDESIPKYHPNIIKFKNEGNNEILIYLSNFHYSKGGLWNTILIGKYNTLKKRKHTSLLLFFITWSAIITISFFYLSIFLIRKKEKLALYFSLWTIMGAIWYLFGNEYYPIIELTSLNWFILIRIEYLSYFLGILFFILYSYQLILHSFNKYIKISSVIFCTISSIAVLVLPTIIFTNLLIIFQLFTTLITIYIVYQLIKHLNHDTIFNRIILFSFLILIILIIHDILSTFILYETKKIGFIGIFLFVAIQAFALAYRFISSLTKVEILSERITFMNTKLETLVAKRTQQLKEANIQLKSKKQHLEKQAEELSKLNEELQKLSTIAQETDNAITIVDITGKILWINKGFEKMYGYTIQEVRDKLGNFIQNASRNQDIKKIFESAITENKSKLYESFIKTNKGEKIEVQTTLTPILNNYNEILYLVAVDTDIRLLKKTQRELKQQNNEINNLFSIISHDLKSPFQGLIGITNILLTRFDSYDKKQIFEFIKDLNDVANRTYILIKNLLDWSLSQSGRLQLTFEKVNISNTIENTLLLFNQNFKVKEIKTDVNVNVNEHVYGDSKSIETIVRNIISNALKFTPRNGIIEIWITENENTKSINIKDNGIGMSEDTINKILKKDSSYTTVGTENEKGTGLGLSLCIALISRNNGIININSS